MKDLELIFLLYAYLQILLLHLAYGLLLKGFYDGYNDAQNGRPFQ